MYNRMGVGVTGHPGPNALRRAMAKRQEPDPAPEETSAVDQTQGKLSHAELHHVGRNQPLQAAAGEGAAKQLH